MKTLNALSAAVALTITTSASANLNLYKTNDYYSGYLSQEYHDGQYGLEWLPVVNTAGQSFNEVTARFETDLAGWRYATGDEFDRMVSRHGISSEEPCGGVAFCGYIAEWEDSDAAWAMSDLTYAIGAWHTDFAPTTEAHGMLADVAGEGMQWTANIADWQDGSYEGLSRYDHMVWTHLTTMGQDRSLPWIGSYLVRGTDPTLASEVTSPGTIALLAIGLAALVRLRRNG